MQKLKKELLRYKYIMRGSMVERYHKCGKSNCVCHKDSSKQHGPYYYYTRKEKGKTIGKVYKEREAKIITPYLSNYNAVAEIVRKISEISERIIFDEITAKRKETRGGRNRPNKYK